MPVLSLKRALISLRRNCAIAMALRAENWPQWRGPSGSGVSSETGLPTKWSRDENIAWKAPLDGLGVSSPIVWDDRVIVTYQIGASALRPGSHPTLVQGPDAAHSGEHPLGGGSRRAPEPGGGKIALVVAAFQRTDGHQLWQYSVNAEGELPTVHEKRNLATSSPVTDGERIYAWFANGQLVVLDLNGKLAWTRRLGKEYAPFNIDWGHSSSPALYRDRIILVCYEGSAAYLLGLDKRTGKELWRLDREKGLKSYSTPIVVEAAKGPELVLNTSEGIEAYNPVDGKPLWQFKEPNRFPIPMPVYHDGMLYLSRGYRSGPYMALQTGLRGDISKTGAAWHSETGAPYISSLVYYDGLLYMAGELGIVTCIDAKNGEHVWRQRLGGFYSASPVAADGKIYFVGETGETLVLRAGRTPEVLAKNDIGEQCIASPAISNKQLFIRTDQNLIAIRAAR